MNAQIANELDMVRDSVLKTVPVEAIYLFGSYAYGTPNAESDLDIYVVVPDDIVDLSEVYASIQGLLWKKKNVPVDLLMSHSGVFHRRKTGPTLERVVAQKGILIYDA